MVMNDVGLQHIVTGEQRAHARKRWNSPRLLRLQAGQAEAGANPARPEGPFATGS
jgi:hypothetical protein